MMIIPLGRELDGVHLLTLAEQSGAVQRERTELRERERERERERVLKKQNPPFIAAFLII
jgi:hypothetical protein